MAARDAERVYVGEVGGADAAEGTAEEDVPGGAAVVAGEYVAERVRAGSVGFE